LVDQVRERISEWNGTAQQPVPMELVTTSGSGLDPHLTLAAAKFQAVRVAAARGVSEQALDRLIQAQLTTPLVGPAIVNVLALNLALADNPQPDSGE
jgi:K+-transporting ATPase ATPase C chain